MVSLKTYVSVCAQELGGPSLRHKGLAQYCVETTRVKRLHLLVFFHLAEQKPIKKNKQNTPTDTLKNVASAVIATTFVRPGVASSITKHTFSMIA